MSLALDTATDLPVLSLAADLPGFPGRRRFVIVRIGEDDTLNVLRCLDDEELSFLVVPAAPFFPDYAPELDDEAVRLLELESAEDALVFLVVSVGERAEDSTVNLMAPLVVNRHKLTAAQVVLSGSVHPLRQPLGRAA